MQERVLGVFLFIILMDKIQFREKIEKLRVHYKNMQPVEISECFFFANDVVLPTLSENMLQRNLETCDGTQKSLSMKFDLNKTKILETSREKKVWLIIDRKGS